VQDRDVDPPEAQIKISRSKGCGAPCDLPRGSTRGELRAGGPLVAIAIVTSAVVQITKAVVRQVRGFSDERAFADPGRFPRRDRSRG